jgi:hypothetical protein
MIHQNGIVNILKQLYFKHFRRNSSNEQPVSWKIQQTLAESWMN